MSVFDTPPPDSQGGLNLSTLGSPDVGLLGGVEFDFLGNDLLKNVAPFGNGVLTGEFKLPIGQILGIYVNAPNNPIPNIFKSVVGTGNPLNAAVRTLDDKGIIDPTDMKGGLAQIGAGRARVQSQGQDM
jgi:hypothetical protein